MSNDPLQDVMVERARQDTKWGVQNHTPEKWLAILVEEVGEVAKTILEREPNNYRKEMVEVCAVALAALESHERWGGRFPPLIRGPQ